MAPTTEFWSGRAFLGAHWPTLCRIRIKARPRGFRSPFCFEEYYFSDENMPFFFTSSHTVLTPSLRPQGARSCRLSPAAMRCLCRRERSGAATLGLFMPACAYLPALQAAGAPALRPCVGERAPPAMSSGVLRRKRWPTDWGRSQTGGFLWACPERRISPTWSVGPPLTRLRSHPPRPARLAPRPTHACALFAGDRPSEEEG